ncbi:MAG: hypothetical protein ABSH53_17270 [Holophaga sp.]
MNAAKARFKLEFHRQVLSLDIPEMLTEFPECEEAFEETLLLIQSRRDDMAPKRGKLLGSFSASFLAGPGRDSAEVEFRHRPPWNWKKPRDPAPAGSFFWVPRKKD